jgi:peptidoglycan hydrolase-like protein with peptidoglycan-binding domain
MRAGRVALVAIAVVAAGGATTAATGLDFGRKGTANAGATNLPPGTAKVTRQTLTDTQDASGSLGYGETTALTSRLSGTLTGVTVPGATVRRGDPLFRVDNTPVLLLYGALPAYRALATGDKGEDVKQFEENLYALGYRGFTVDTEYSASTAAAVKKWQKKLGLTGTGTIELGRVVYASGPVRVDSLTATLGSGLQPDKEVLQYTGTTRVVTVDLDVSDGRLAKTGAAVRLTLPGGEAVPGKIAKVVTVIKPAQGNNPASTKIEVTAAADDEQALAGLDQATITVGFTAAQREHVLTVPVAALLALAEGGYGVQVVDGANSRLVAVTTGLFAGGRVEVTGEGLTEGTTVGMPS